MSDYTRRRLLALGGAITAGAVAGCSGPENAAEAGSTPEASAGPTLQTISLQNLDDDDRTVDVIAQWGDTIEYWGRSTATAVLPSTAAGRPILASSS